MMTKSADQREAQRKAFDDLREMEATMAAAEGIPLEYLYEEDRGRPTQNRKMCHWCGDLYERRSNESRTAFVQRRFCGRSCQVRQQNRDRAAVNRLLHGNA